MADLLSINDLTVSFNSGSARITAVDGLSYSINSGEVVGVVGESGSGEKRTCLGHHGGAIAKRCRADRSRLHIV